MIDYEEMQCMEIRGGNQAVDTGLRFPGLDVWLWSAPAEGDRSGGDIHYASLCGEGLLARIILLDVAGHGSAVDELSRSVFDLVRAHINTIDQSDFARELNRDIGAIGQSGRFATGLMLGYVNPKRMAIISSAGHPAPIIKRAARNEWAMLADGDLTTDGASGDLDDLPLGVIVPTGFSQSLLRLEEGDCLLLYTDGLSEARAPNGQMLGLDGILHFLNECGAGDPGSMLHTLCGLMDANGIDTDGDDLSLLLLCVRS